jgi:hypothetical protein
MTDSSWYTLKFIPDLVINQAYNVGVVAVAGRQVEARFLGEDASGHIDGRKLPRDLPTQTFKDWVAFTRRTAESGRLDERIERLATRRRNDQFIIEKRGPVFGGRSLGVVVQELYARVVTVDSSLGEVTTNLTAAADSVVRSLDVQLEKDVALEVEDRKGVRHLLPFAYRHKGDHTTLLDRITLRDRTSESAFVESLLFRIDLAETRASIRNFIVLYRAADDTRMVDRGIQRLERYANAVNVDDPEASHHVASILDVGLLPSVNIAEATSH